MQIIDGRKIRDGILAELKKEVTILPFAPVFCDVLVGEDPSSMQYVKTKAKAAESVGVKFHEARFPASADSLELAESIKKLNEVPNMCGVIVQLPLPPHIDRQKVLDAIDPALDVDCLSTSAKEKFYSGKGVAASPAALACIYLLDSLGLGLPPSLRKNIVVLGQGELVGKPVAALLKFRGHEPQIVGSNTPDKEEIIKQADVIISGIGKPGYIKGDMIKKGAVLIDAGTSESEGGIAGDVDMDSVKGVAGYVSPVPGGVGPVTVAMLLRNVLQTAKNKTT